MTNRTSLLIQDEVQAKNPVDVAWSLLTPATVTLLPGNAPTTAKLTLNDQTLYAHILAPAGATFQASPADAPPPQKPNPGITHLMATSPEKTTSLTLLIRITPAEKPDPNPIIVPLKNWSGYCA